MIKQPETPEEFDKAYDLICQLHKALSYPVADRAEHDRRLALACKGGYTQYLLYDESGVIVGLLALRVLDDLLRPRRLFIDDLVIDEAHRGQGYSKILLNFAFKLGGEEQCARVDLEAALKNERAIAVYEKQNFEKVAYLMKKVLPES